MGTIIVGGLLILMITCIIRKMVRDKKNSKFGQCTGDCQHCGKYGH